MSVADALLRSAASSTSQYARFPLSHDFQLPSVSRPVNIMSAIDACMAIYVSHGLSSIVWREGFFPTVGSVRPRLFEFEVLVRKLLSDAGLRPDYYRVDREEQYDDEEDVYSRELRKQQQEEFLLAHADLLGGKQKVAKKKEEDADGCGSSSGCSSEEKSSVEQLSTQAAKKEDDAFGCGSSGCSSGEKSSVLSTLARAEVMSDQHVQDESMLTPSLGFVYTAAVWEKREEMMMARMEEELRSEESEESEEDEDDKKERELFAERETTVLLLCCRIMWKTIYPRLVETMLSWEECVEIKSHLLSE